MQEEGKSVEEGDNRCRRQHGGLFMGRGGQREDTFQPGRGSRLSQYLPMIRLYSVKNTNFGSEEHGFIICVPILYTVCQEH